MRALIALAALVAALPAYAQRWSLDPLIDLGKSECRTADSGLVACKLPAWFDYRKDRTWTIADGAWTTTCLQDAESGARAVTGTSTSKLAGLWNTLTWQSSGAGRWTTPEQWASCHPTTARPYAMALGEPAYWSVSYLDAANNSDPNWAQMNATVIAGTTERGEPLTLAGDNATGTGSTDPKVRWCLVGRHRSPGGLTATTRCLVP